MVYPDYKILHVIMNQYLRLNGTNITFSVTLFWLLQNILYSICVMPLMLGTRGGFVSLVLLIVACVFVGILEYGLNVIILRMVEKKYVTLGFLFYGFKDSKKKNVVLKASILFTSLYALSIFIGTLIFVFGGLKLWGTDVPPISEGENGSPVFSTPVYITAFAILAFIFLLKLFFIFVWPLIFDTQYDKIFVFKTFAKSFSMVCSQFFRFIGFCIYAAGHHLITLISILILRFFVSNEILFYFLNFLFIINLFRVLARVKCAQILYYYAMIGKLQIYKSEYIPPVANDENMEKK